MFTSAPHSESVVVVSPDRIVRALAAVVCLLVGVSCLGQVSKFFLGHDHLFGLIRLTYLNGEATIPAWYSSSALLLCAGALAVVASAKRSRGDRWSRYWVGLALLFVYLSADESAGIHELWGKGIKDRFAPTGFFLFAWVIPGMIAVLAIGLAYLKFLWNLPAETRRAFILAGCVFVGGALGVEMLGAKHLSIVGVHNFTHSLLITLEEAAEMFGVLILLHAVLQHLATECGVALVEIRAAERPVTGRQVVASTNRATVIAGGW